MDRQPIKYIPMGIKMHTNVSRSVGQTDIKKKKLAIYIHIISLSRLQV